MEYDDFMQSLEQDSPPDMEACLQALWYDFSGDWQRAHEIVQAMHTSMAARIHAYLHRKEGDEWNSKYWHRVAGSRFPDHLSLEQEWEMLVKQLIDKSGQ